MSGVYAVLAIVLVTSLLAHAWLQLAVVGAITVATVLVRRAWRRRRGGDGHAS